MRLFLAVVFCFNSILASSQSKAKESYYVFNSDWKPCKIDSAKYLAYLRQLNDTTWQWYYYNFTGPLINIETYRDENATLPNGYFAYFNTKGKIDSDAHVVNGLRNGSWFFYGDSIKPQLTREYDMGTFIKEKVTEPVKESDVLLTAGEREAEFVGGTKNWIKYLQKNLETPERAMGLRMSGTVVIGFTINIKGEVEQGHIVKSVEYSLDQEAIHLINNSPAWTPALHENRAVRAYRLQPITFRIE